MGSLQALVHRSTGTRRGKRSELVVARYVLLEFDDNDEANNFVAILNGGDFDGRAAEAMPGGTIRVRAVYFKPTQFCEHTAKERGERTARGAKYGLRVCNLCYKPVRGHTQHPRNLLVDQEADQKLPILQRAQARLYLGVQEG